jgi:hypothetical protein
VEKQLQMLTNHCTHVPHRYKGAPAEPRPNYPLFRAHSALLHGLAHGPDPVQADGRIASLIFRGRDHGWPGDQVIGRIIAPICSHSLGTVHCSPAIFELARPINATNVDGPRVDRPECRRAATTTQRLNRNPSEEGIVRE